MGVEVPMSLSVFLLASISLSGCTQSGMQKKVGPAPSFIASTDEHFVARGRYLAENVTGCIGCHSTLNEEVYARPVVEGSEGMGGQTWPLSDGHLGMLTAGNITPFGIGDWTDGEILHAVSAGVHRALTKRKHAIRAQLRTLAWVENSAGRMRLRHELARTRVERRLHLHRIRVVPVGWWMKDKLMKCANNSRYHSGSISKNQNSLFKT